MKENDTYISRKYKEKLIFFLCSYTYILYNIIIVCHKSRNIIHKVLDLPHILVLARNEQIFDFIEFIFCITKASV